MTERLEAAGIRRHGVVFGRGFKSHWELRASLGDAEPNRSRPGDEEGFITSTGRLVSRRDAIAIGIAAGQLDRQWLGAHRALLSSDINW